ncbi:MAG: hypothetical protein ACI9IP_001305 [Arcticibacterium sp.]|jgi:hypothetical protein
MNTLLKKLNFKTQESILVLNTPVEFKRTAEDFSQYLGVRTEIDKSEIQFSLIFCTKLSEIEQLAPKIIEHLVEDGLFWFAYPKKSSKKYNCAFNRDNGWQVLGDLGFEGVRMIAIDEDWSAVRFRRPEKMKELKRDPSWIRSEAGKKKVKS